MSTSRPSPAPRHALARFVLALLALVLFAPLALAAPDGDAELGRRLYEHGIGHDGEPIRTIGQISYEGEQAACLRCHRRSGFGGSEGGYYVPPITANFLFEPTRHDRNDRFRAAFLEAQNTQHWIRARMPRSRPAYTLETLAQALRDGHNPSGTKFEALMPRYELDDRDVANVTAYLRGLSKEVSPGVDDEFLHIATVVGPGVDPGQRDAMLRTTEAYVKWYNERLLGDLTHQASTRAYGMQFRSSTRLWKLHVWNLEGPGESWAEQLERHQAGQPAFLIVNGLVEGPWTPVAEFCDAQRMPCVFPLTELPDTQRDLGGYSVYYSRGLELEADLLGHYLSGMEAMPTRLVQLHDRGEHSRRPAERFARFVAERLPGIELTSILVEEAPGPALAEAMGLLAAESSSNPGSKPGLVVWPGAYLDQLPAALDREALRDIPLFATSHLIRSEQHGASGLTTTGLSDRLHIAWPYSLPDAYHSDSFRVRGWMRSRSLPVTHERIQFMSYYSMGILRDSTRHMFEHFHRDYLIERIEHEVDGAANPGFFPVLALGPEQRMLSKGGYVLRATGPDGRTLVAGSQWMIP